MFPVPGASSHPRVVRSSVETISHPPGGIERPLQEKRRADEHSPAWRWESDLTGGVIRSGRNLIRKRSAPTSEPILEHQNAPETSSTTGPNLEIVCAHNSYVEINGCGISS